jgi:hypothetical protein
MRVCVDNIVYNSDTEIKTSVDTQSVMSKPPRHQMYIPSWDVFKEGKTEGEQIRRTDLFTK